MGQALTTSKFYFYGRTHFTRTGWEAASKNYPQPDLLTTIDLSNRTYLVTGANSGIGFTVSEYLASRGAHVYMVCRNESRASKAREDILAQHPNALISVLLGDCGLSSDVKRVVSEFASREKKLDGLVCNAGALLNEKTLSPEGVEVTFATHLLFGTYLLTELSIPLLRESSDPRVVVVSSGGMYNTKFPSWKTATSENPSRKYDGQLAYAFAKRGQVLLCEEWAKLPSHAPIRFLSCHPGWCDTPGVTEAYGESRKYLQPLRTLREGAEGIMWLCAVDGQQLENGAFYLDRSPQLKYLPGWFSTESSTANSRDEIDGLMNGLKTHSRL